MKHQKREWTLSPARPLITLLLALLLLTLSALPRLAAAEAVPVKPVATVNGQPITPAEVDAHCTATGLTRPYAIEDLVFLQLVRSAAATRKIDVPAGFWDEATRNRIEFSLAKTLDIDPPVRILTLLVVDHGWLRDATDAAGQAAGGKQLEELRTAVAKGETIPAAFSRLGFDGTNWHIGDHEEYPLEVLPAELRDLKADSLSPVIPGDGGRHLFRIYERREVPPPPDEVRMLLRAALYSSETVIEWGEEEQQ